MAFLNPDGSAPPAPPQQPNPLFAALLRRGLLGGAVNQSGLPQASQVPGFAAGDPGYQAALASQLQGNSNADSALKAAREQALIQFGDPNLASQYSNLDPAIQNLINANTNSGNSVLAHLGQARDQARQSILSQLAAHGLIKSGGLGSGLSQVAQNYGHNLYDAQQNVLGQLNTQLQSYLQQKSGYQDTANQALQSAYQNYVSNPALYTGAGGQNLPAPHPAPTPQARLAGALASMKAPSPAPTPSRIGGLSSNPTQGTYSVH